MTFAAIWDMDGTLVDTAELHFDAWQVACREKGRDFTRADFAATFGRRNPEIIDYLLPGQFNAEQGAAFGDHKEDLYRTAALKAGVTLLPGVKNLLEGLHQAGFRQAIGSSALRGNLELILKLTGEARFFDAVVAMEDTQRGKPDPQVFLMGAQKLGVDPSRCVVFEDAVAGIQAAKAGGMKAVAVRFVGHHSAGALRAAGADCVVNSLEELDVKSIETLLSERLKEPAV